MSSKVPSEDLSRRVGDVPIHTRTRVLGVSIEVPQLQHRCEMLDEDYPLAGSNAVDVRAAGSDKPVDWHDRRYIAAWARRNLFDGAQPYGGQQDA